MRNAICRGFRSVYVFGCVLILVFCVSGVAFAAPDGRVYEMVSPIYKGGYGVGGLGGAINAVAPDGESIAFYSKGIFAGAPSGPISIDYIAHRSGSGWSTTALMPPAALLPTVGTQDVSSSLGSIVELGNPGPNQKVASQAGTETVFLLHDTSALDTETNWEPVGIPIKALDGEPVGVKYAGASENWCQLIVTNQGQALLPETLGRANLTEVYELNRGCNGEPRSLRLVGAKNNLGPNGEPEPIASSCGTSVGNAQDSQGKSSQFNAVSADGREVFFQMRTVEKQGFCEGAPQLFVRLDGKRTLEVSKPVSEAEACGEAIPCPGAATRASGDFAGASEDGSTMFLTTAASLVGEDKDGKNDLYMARIGCSQTEEGCEVARKEVTSLVQVSHDPAVGEAAEVQGVVRVAPDGSRVYFVALGVLSEGQNVEGQAPVKGADNLYVYDSVSGKTTFVTDLSGFDMGLWAGSVAEAQTAGLDGRFLVFSSYAQLVRDDTDTAKDVYRYDAETGVLSRVSVGEEGYDANGNGEFDATITPANEGGSVLQQYEMNSRAISEDGSRIVFGTSEPLSPGAVNGLENVYEWHLEPGASEGKVSLVSSGSAEEPVSEFVIDPTGSNVFFVTTQGLVPQDVDGAPDVYDARLKGGFPISPESRQPCAGDACQGPLTNPTPLLVPGSVSQAPGENLAFPQTAMVSKAKKSRTSAKRKKRKTKKSSVRGKGAVRERNRGRL